MGQTKNTDWIVKHACRTLLKAGNKRAMLLFGYSAPSHIKVEQLALDKNSLVIGETLQFSFTLHIKEQERSRVRLEYAVYFMKSKGKQTKKVFKITENSYESGRHTFSKNHSFKDMSTRKHYEGIHHIEIIINGEEMAKISFELTRGKA